MKVSTYTNVICNYETFSEIARFSKAKFIQCFIRTIAIFVCPLRKNGQTPDLGKAQKIQIYFL